MSSAWKQAMGQTARPPERPAPELRAIDWQSVLAEREEQARELIRAHPVASLLGAALLGFGIARLLRDER